MKRLRALLLAFLILLSGVAMPAGAVYYYDIVCVWAGGNILPIQEGAMPFIEGNQYYVPVTVFRDYLGVKVSENRQSNILALSKGGRSISYNRSSDLAIDGDAQFYQNRVYYRNNIWYVPAVFTAERLGLYSHIYTAFTPTLIYLDEASSGLSTDDAEWFLLYGTLMADRYRQYTSEGSGGESTSTSTESSGSTNTAEPEKAHYTVYLAFSDFPNSRSAEVLDILKRAGLKATFLVTGKNVTAETEGLVRRAAAEGHTLALSSWSGDAELFYSSPESAVGELAKTNGILSKVLHTSLRLVLPPEGKTRMNAEFADALVGEGYRFWTSTVTAYGTGKKADAIYRDTVKVIEGSERPVVAEFPGRSTTPALLERLLSFLAEADTTYRRLSLLDQPQNSLYDLR